MTRALEHCRPICGILVELFVCILKPVNFLFILNHANALLKIIDGHCFKYLTGLMLKLILQQISVLKAHCRQMLQHYVIFLCVLQYARLNRGGSISDLKQTKPHGKYQKSLWPVLIGAPHTPVICLANQKNYR